MDPPDSAGGNFYAIPELAAQYDADGEGRQDFPFYLHLASSLHAHRVIDIGAGTGLLCSLLAEAGHEVLGVEPQDTMLRIARTQPRAAEVTWLHGTAADLPTGWADLVLMTGHVAQYFLDDDAWREVLIEAHRALRPGGHVAFESRNPARQEWLEWASDEPRRTASGTVRTSVHRDGDLVTHVDRWLQDGRAWTTSETLRFPAWENLVRGLTTAGFTVARSWGGWAGEPITALSPEWIILAARPTQPAGQRRRWQRPHQ